MTEHELLQKVTCFEHCGYRVIKRADQHDHGTNTGLWFVAHSHTLNYYLREDGSFNCNMWTEDKHLIAGNKVRYFISPVDAINAIDEYLINYPL